MSRFTDPDDGRLFRLCFGTFAPAFLVAAFTAQAWALPTPPADLEGAMRFKDVEFYVPQAIPLPPPEVIPVTEAREAPASGTTRRAEAFAERTIVPPAARSGAATAEELFGAIGTVGQGLDADRQTTDAALDRAMRGIVAQGRSLDEVPDLGGGRESGPRDDVAVGIQIGRGPERIGLLESAPLGGPQRRAEVVPEGAPEEDGELGDLATVLRTNRGRIESCVSRALAANPGLSGKIAVAWDVNGGRVSNVRVLESTAEDAEFDACVRRAVSNLRFAPGSTGRVDRYTWLVSGR